MTRLPRDSDSREVRGGFAQVFWEFLMRFAEDSAEILTRFSGNSHDSRFPGDLILVRFAEDSHKILLRLLWDSHEILGRCRGDSHDILGVKILITFP